MGKLDDLSLDDEQIMKIFKLKPGPQVGKIKKYIEEAIIEGKIPNEHDAAFEYLIQYKKNLR